MCRTRQTSLETESMKDKIFFDTQNATLLGGKPPQAKVTHR